MVTIPRAFNAVLGGYTVGDRARQGDVLRAVATGLTLAVPLLWKKRVGMLALAGAVAVATYLLAEEFERREAVLEPVETPAGPSLN